jgi:hypothetical protein
MARLLSLPPLVVIPAMVVIPPLVIIPAMVVIPPLVIVPAFVVIPALVVIPAKAGTQSRPSDGRDAAMRVCSPWVPASAGMAVSTAMAPKARPALG